MPRPESIFQLVEFACYVAAVQDELFIVQVDLPHVAAGLRKASGWPLFLAEAERLLGLSGFDHLDEDLWLCSAGELRMLDPEEVVTARPLR